MLRRSRPPFWVSATKVFPRGRSFRTFTCIKFCSLCSRIYFNIELLDFFSPLFLSPLGARICLRCADMSPNHVDAAEAAGWSPDHPTPVSLIFTVACHRRRARQSTAGVWRRSERPVWRVSHQPAKTRPDERRWRPLLLTFPSLGVLETLRRRRRPHWTGMNRTFI